MAWDWYVRVFIPAWLVLTPSLAEHAKALESLAPIVDDANATDVRKKLAAAGAAARAAARAAAWDAARDAAWDAAWDAEWDAAWAKLAPTVTALQASAVNLVERMCDAKE
jgi:hypothetical protein